MSTSSNQVSTALRKDLLKGMNLSSPDQQPSEGDKLVGGNKVTDTQSFIKIAHFTGPIGPAPVGERETLPEGRYDKVRTAEYSNQAYGLLLSFSKEVWQDNQYKDVLMQGYGQDLRELCADVRDIALVNEFFNLAGTNTGPDGQYYIDTDHPLDAEAAELTEDNTATASNRIDGDPTVSTEALNDGVDMLKRQVTNKGRRAGVMPPVFIECDSKREVLWKSIASPVNGHEPFTMDHNPGQPYAAMIAGVIGLTRSTHDDWFMLRTANSRKMHRFVWDRQAPEVSEMQQIIRDRTMECNVDFRLSKGVFDWRGVVGSLAGA
jgi:hypothetical protein